MTLLLTFSWRRQLYWVRLLRRRAAGSFGVQQRSELRRLVVVSNLLSLLRMQIYYFILIPDTDMNLITQLLFAVWHAQGIMHSVSVWDEAQWLLRPKVDSWLLDPFTFPWLTCCRWGLAFTVLRFAHALQLLAPKVVPLFLRAGSFLVTLALLFWASLRLLFHGLK